MNPEHYIQQLKDSLEYLKNQMKNTYDPDRKAQIAEDCQKIESQLKTFKQLNG